MCVIILYIPLLLCDMYRDCKGMGQLCSGHSQPYILFGWGRNASGIQLPQGNVCRVTVCDVLFGVLKVVNSQS